MSVSIKSLFDNRHLQFVLAMFAVLAFYFPYIYNGEDSFITIHDNLDSNLSWVKILLDSGTMFSSPQELVPEVFNGIPRSALYGNYDIGLLWFYLFGMYEGYIINKIIMSLVAFFGMYYLLSRNILPKHTTSIIVFGTSLLFALLPFWSFTLSVSGLPFVFYAFLNLRNRNSEFLNWAILVVFAFYSSLVLSGIFFIIFLIFILLYDFFRDKSMNFNSLGAIAVLCVSYTISHFPLIYSFLFAGDYVSHRTAFNLRPWTLSESIDKLDEIIRFGQYHAHSLHTYLLIPIGVVFILKLLKKPFDKKFNASIIFIALTSVLYAVVRWDAMSSIFNPVTQLIPLQFQRFHFLHPIVWYVLLALSLTFIFKYGRIGKSLVLLILLFQLGFIINKHEYVSSEEPSFKEFYAELLFDEVKKYIGLPLKDYRVITIGTHPSIAQFNGFYTLDGYFPNYPLAHKIKFRKVIAGELKKDTYLTYYYDCWGSRCYAFNQTLRRADLDPNPRKIKKLDFNFKALNDMGGSYLLSTAEIDTEYAKDLQLEHIFEHPDSYWKIHLYKNLAKP